MRSKEKSNAKIIQFFISSTTIGIHHQYPQVQLYVQIQKTTRAFCFRRQHLKVGGGPAGALPENGDPCLISAKEVYVPLHPLE